MWMNKLAAMSAVVLSTAAPVQAQQGAEIAWMKDVSLRVGQSAVVYGYRGDCGSMPALSEVRVPATKTGKLSFGKEGWRKSKKCGGPTPAIALIFTATAPGSETIKIQGDQIRINVRN